MKSPRKLLPRMVFTIALTGLIYGGADVDASQGPFPSTASGLLAEAEPSGATLEQGAANSRSGWFGLLGLLGLIGLLPRNSHDRSSINPTAR